MLLSFSTNLFANQDTTSIKVNYGVSLSAYKEKNYYSGSYNRYFSRQVLTYIETKHHKLSLSPNIGSKKGLYVGLYPSKTSNYEHYSENIRYTNGLFYYNYPRYKITFSGFYFSYQLKPVPPQKIIDFFFRYDFDFNRFTVKQNNLYSTNTEDTGIHTAIFDDKFKYVNTNISHYIMIGYKIKFLKHFDISHSFGIGLNSIKDDFKFSDKKFNFTNGDIDLMRTFRFTLNYTINDFEIK